MNLKAGELAAALLNGCQHHGLDWGEEAAIHLLIAQGTWLRRENEFRRHISITDTLIEGVSAYADWSAIANEPDRSPASSGERAILRLACHLAGHIPGATGSQWALAEILAPLDATNAMLASRAVAMAAVGPDLVGPLQPS